MNSTLFTLGRGIGQVMFQNNALSGIIMLLGIFLNSWQMGLLALAGNGIGTLTAYLSGYKQEDIRAGLYGFNGTLVGIAIGVFMQISLSSVLLMVIASAFSTWVTRLFGKQRWLPGFTAPFIITVWLLLGICSLFFPSLFLSSSSFVMEYKPDLFRAFSLNIGQVMFQGETIVSGLFFLAAIFINSRLNAFYVVLASLLSVVVSLFSGAEYSVLNMGLMGYNGVLCAIALGDRTWKGAFYAVLSVLISMLLQFIGMKLGIVTLTAPFVLSVWCTMGINKLASGKKKMNVLF